MRDNKPHPVELWEQGVTFWARLWQAQIDQSLKFWAAWASALPRPSAAQLSSEAEALRDLTTPDARPSRTARTAGDKELRPKPVALH